MNIKRAFWIELSTKFAVEPKYIWLIFILPIIFVFLTPIIYGSINGTLRFPAFE
jgi:hypothetical protein